MRPVCLAGASACDSGLQEARTSGHVSAHRTAMTPQGVRNGHTSRAPPVGETLPQWDTSGTPRLFSGEGWIARDEPFQPAPPGTPVASAQDSGAGEPATAL